MMDSSNQASDFTPSSALNSAPAVSSASGNGSSVDSASSPEIEDLNPVPGPGYARITGNNPALVHPPEDSLGVALDVSMKLVLILKRLLIDLGEGYNYWKCIVQADIS